METLFVFLVILFGLIGFLSPCTWNLNAILIANAKEKGKIHLLYFLFFRTLLYTLLGTFVYVASDFVNITTKTLIIIHLIITFIFLFGSPLMKKFKFAPIDLSVQAIFPKLKLPAGIAIGLNLPYCSIPFFILIESYGMFLGGFYPVYFAFLFAVTSTIPTFASYFFSKETFKKINEFIPAIPYVSGILVIIVLMYLLNQSIFTIFSLFDFFHEKHHFLVSAVVVFILGALTSTGPSTLPFLPVIAGILVSGVNSKFEVFKSIFGFTFAFVLSHIAIGVTAFFGFVFINKLFNVQLFNILLGLFLFFLSLNFLGVLNTTLNLPKLRIYTNEKKGFLTSFILGVVYTFSICPSCTGFLLGAVTLAVSTGNLVLNILIMTIYAIGRSLIVFLFGFLFNTKTIQNFILNNYQLAKKFIGVIFFVLSLYFIQKGIL